MIRGGFAQVDLNALSALSPPAPSWLDPRAADFDMHREPWQIELAPLVDECRRAAVGLRVIGDI